MHADDYTSLFLIFHIPIACYIFFIFPVMQSRKRFLNLLNLRRVIYVHYLLIFIGFFAEKTASFWNVLLAYFIVLSPSIMMHLVINNHFKNPNNIPEPDEPTHKQCPYCAEVVLIEAIKCKHCHSELQ